MPPRSGRDGRRRRRRGASGGTGRTCERTAAPPDLHHGRHTIRQDERIELGKLQEDALIKIDQDLADPAATQLVPAAALEALRARLLAARVPLRDDGERVAGLVRFFAEDPWGNRLEFVAPA